MVDQEWRWPGFAIFGWDVIGHRRTVSRRFRLAYPSICKSLTVSVETGKLWPRWGNGCGSDSRRDRAAGLAYVPEERMRDGVVGEFSVAENLILVAHDSDPG
ncbi:MAG: hypothetical protein CM1200mP26_24140 [Acidimicrobiales bacterium]|nr:MAG: hypothetical protein CM1200mP26_24140 [Acidimicrobiales bacterium]